MFIVGQCGNCYSFFCCRAVKVVFFFVVVFFFFLNKEVSVNEESEIRDIIEKEGVKNAKICKERKKEKKERKKERKPKLDREGKKRKKAYLMRIKEKKITRESMNRI